MKTKFLPESENTEQVIEQCDLVLYNDDVHTFYFVIKTLIEVCEHNYLQAVQCTYLVHYGGKCSVKHGTYHKLKPKCESLIEKGLVAEIQ